MAPRKKQPAEQVEMSVEELEGETVELEGQEVDPDQFEDEIDGDEELLPNGPTHNQVEDWKGRFNGKVFLTQVGGQPYVFRPIRRNEYKAVMKVRSDDRYYTEEKICATCVIFPENFQQTAMAHGLAGTPTVLAEMILEQSGFNPNIESIQL